VSITKQSYSILWSFLFVFFIVSAFGSIITWASESTKVNELISISAKEDTLGNVLRMIAEKSGYDIEIDSEYAKIPIWVSFEDLTVHQALRRVLGQLNRYVLIDETNRKIRFGLVSTGPASGTDKIAQKKSTNNLLDLEVVPPATPGERGITYQELEQIRKSKPKYDPLDSEPVPPSKLGGQAITYRELEKIRKSRPKYDPLDFEVVPPDEPGKAGITYRQLESIKKSAKTYAPLDTELAPPVTAGGKSITAREVVRKPYDPDDLEIAPPDAPGGQGYTKGDIETLRSTNQ
jgi:hypothetical protein